MMQGSKAYINKFDKTIIISLKLQDLTLKFKTPHELKQIALETIQIHYPEPQWLHIYTDGSRMNIEDGAGAGIYSKLFTVYVAVGKNSTHFDGEIQAIEIALTQLLYRIKSFNCRVILSDSISAI